MADMIELKKISKIYNEGKPDAFTALEDIDLTVKKGEMISVMGVSGSGKTTLLNILGCIDNATSGEYYLDGENVARRLSDTLSRIRNEKIGFILQDYALIEDKTALQNVMYPLAFAKGVSYKSMKSRALEALKALKIDELKNKRVFKLSGGQKQRVAIARAIVNHPKLILADEPTSALDRRTADEIMSVFSGLNKSGVTVIIVTHDKRIADMCARTVYISEGRISEAER
ncbi:MAG: ABC transporter ATP-binding protein [Oscillospiraceae bacterium]